MIKSYCSYKYTTRCKCSDLFSRNSPVLGDKITFTPVYHNILQMFTEVKSNKIFRNDSIFTF